MMGRQLLTCTFAFCGMCEMAQWGRWNSFGMLWCWAQFHPDPNFTLALGASQKSGEYNPGNKVWIDVDGVRHIFPPKLARAEYTDFVPSDVPLHKYPRHAKFTSENDEGLAIVVQWEVLRSPSISKSAVVVFEQVSTVDVLLTNKKTGATRTWRGTGYTEWTDHLLL